MGLLDNEGNDAPVALATAKNNLALMYDKQGRYDEAEPMFIQALSIVENALGDLHSYVIIFLKNMAVLYHKMGDEDKAREYYLRAEARQKKRDEQQS